MRIVSCKLLFVLAVAAVLGLAACDTVGEQNVDWKPGESLTIIGGSEFLFPAARSSFPVTETYRVNSYTIDKNYTWTLNGEAVPEGSVLDDGERVSITFSEPGTYTLAIDDGEEYTGEVTITVTAPGLADQAGRLGFDALASAIGYAGEGGGTLDTTLARILNGNGDDVYSYPETYTLLAPTDTALVRAFDANGDGALAASEVPGPAVLADILAYHAITDSISAEAVTGMAYPTLEGDDIAFDAAATVSGEPAELYTELSFPAGNGLIHTINEVLLPPSASVGLQDQASEDSTTITVRSVYLPEGGFIAIHDSTLLDGNVTGSVIGVSEALDPGLYNNVDVTLFEVPGATFPADTSLSGASTLIAMPHLDSNGNGTYDFVTSGGTADGPYVDAPYLSEQEQAVVDQAVVTVPE